MAQTYSPLLIYEEKKITYWLIALIFCFIGIVFFLVYSQPSYAIIFPFAAFAGLLFALLICCNLSFYSIKIFNDKTIQFGFPAWNKKLQPSEINSIEEIPYHPMREFGGLGWRVATRWKNGKWRIGYVMWLQKGIEIEATNGKYYVFGTDNPQAILSALGQHGGPARI